MKLLISLLILAFATMVAAETCHPQCKWQCDDPSCPAICHPVCARPKCEMRCEETPCAKCVVHCERPTCSIRCPKDQCEKEGCPKCETVCAPPQCHTTCTAPDPKCSPVCEELDCQHKCVKPTNCARPKCELQCEKPACDYNDYQSNNGCCSCTRSATISAIELANKAGPASGEVPSFLEVFHTLTHSAQNGREECCPCN